MTLQSTLSRPSAFLFATLILGSMVISSCGKKTETVQTKSTDSTGILPVVDTNAKAEEVVITDTNHHLYYRPAVGSVMRYHVVDKMTASMGEEVTGNPSKKQTSNSTTVYYLTETVKSINPKDSSVDVVVRIDSMNVQRSMDTIVEHFSSTDAAQRKDPKFAPFSVILETPFTVRANKYGDIFDVPDVNGILANLQKVVPDSIRKKQKLTRADTIQAKQLVAQYAVRGFVHSPTLALVKDTTWKMTSPSKLQIGQSILVPVNITNSQTVKAFEKRGDKVVAVLVDKSSTEPTKSTFDDAGGKGTLQKLVATLDGTSRIEDATGVLFHRAIEERRELLFVYQSKQSDKKLTSTQTNVSTLTVELLK